MEKILPVALTAVLGLVVLTGVSQAQRELSVGGKVNTGLSDAVDRSDEPGGPEDLERNMENMLQLLKDLESDEKTGENMKIFGRERMDVKMANPPANVAGSDKKPPLTPIGKKAKKSHIESANEVVKFVPENSSSHFRLGMDYWRFNNLDAAIRHFEEAVRLDWENAHAYWNLSLLYEDKNMGSEAVDNAIKAKAIYSKYDYSLYVIQARKRLERLSIKYKKQ